MTERITISKASFRKLEKLRPKGKTVNRVIACLLAKTEITKQDVEDFAL